MGRSISAVIAGYLVMAVLILAGTMIHFAVVFGKMPDMNAPLNLPVSFGILSLVYSSIFAAVGGWVCAAIANQNRLKHGVILAGIVVVLSLISAYVDRGKQPLWYQAGLVILSGPATAAGAWVRARKRIGNL